MMRTKNKKTEIRPKTKFESIRKLACRIEDVEKNFMTAEKHLINAYIAIIFCIFPEKEHTYDTLAELLEATVIRIPEAYRIYSYHNVLIRTYAGCSPDYRNAADILFEAAGLWAEGNLPDEDEVMKEYGEEYLDFCHTSPLTEQKELIRFAVREYAKFKNLCCQTAKSTLIAAQTKLDAKAIDEIISNLK